MRLLKVFCLLLAGLVTLPANGVAAPLSGVFNTGTDEPGRTDNATLDVEFGPCRDDPSLSCGVIVRILDPVPGAGDIMPNGEPLVGFAMVKDLEDRGKGKYRGGKINAIDESLEEGEMKWYGVKINALEDGALEVKGCLGPFCPRTLIWRPVDRPGFSEAAETE